MQNLANLIKQEDLRNGKTFLGVTGRYGIPDENRQLVSTSSKSLIPLSSFGKTGYTLSDIYNLINSGATTTTSAHGLSTNSSPTNPTLRSLSEIYASLVALLNGHEGDIANGVTYLGVTGTYVPQVPYAMNFNGMGDKIRLPGDEPLKLLNTSFSISMWVYQDNNWESNVNFAGILGTAAWSPSGTGFYIGTGSTAWGGDEQKKRIMAGGYGLGDVTGEDCIDFLTWNHVVVTYELDGNIKIYCDGTLKATNASVGRMSDYDTTISIGKAWDDGDNRVWKGNMDEIEFFNRVLSDSEVAYLYNQGVGVESSVNDAPFNNGLIAGYNFNEGSGATVNDFSGNGHTATILESGVAPCSDYWDGGSCTAVNGCYWEAPITGYCETYGIMPDTYFDQSSCESANVCFEPSFQTIPYYDEASCTAISDPNYAYSSGLIGYGALSLNVNTSNENMGVMISPLVIQTEISNYTFSAWVFKTSDGGQETIIDNSANHELHFAIESDGRLRVLNTGAGGPYYSTNTVNAGSWHHVVAVIDNEVKLYIDGVLDVTHTRTGNTSVGMDSIGWLGFSNTWTMDGQIDELNIWNRALSTGEVETLYNSGSGLSGDVGVAPFDSGLLAGWHFDYDGINPIDFSANGYTGTVTGTSLNMWLNAGFTWTPDPESCLGTPIVELSRNHYVDGGIPLLLP